jgi:flagellar basal-body rod modification protein FlgD
MTTASTSSASSTAALDAVLNPDRSKKKVEQGSAESFLNMLVTQMKNQDPLNPMDNAQVTSQLAQINTVTGINKLNDTMTALSSTYSASQTMQAANLIGKNVLSPGKNLQLTSAGGIAGGVLDGAADKVTVSIYDSSSQLVATEDLGAKSAGNFLFTWDGKDKNGNALATGDYTFKIAASKGGSEVKSTATQAGTVSAVSLTSTGFQLEVGDSKINYSDVKQII